MKKHNEQELILVRGLLRIACADCPDTREEMIDYAVDVLCEWRKRAGYKEYPPTEEVKEKKEKKQCSKSLISSRPPDIKFSW